VARDRNKRSRARRPRRSDAVARTVRETASTPSQSQPLRADVPAPLEHAGDVDEFDAALVRGAEGVPLQRDGAGNGAGEGTVPAAPERPSRARRGSGGSAADLEEAFGDGVAAEEAPTDRRSTGSTIGQRPGQPIYLRAIAFLRASWAELQRVQWPDRPHVTQATTVVLGFLVVAGVYLGAADWVAQKIVNLIL
jgi:preprotein translocase subunit SecE